MFVKGTHQKPELLAPAGSLESVSNALHFGADAVFLGGSFLQLRADAAGLSDSDLAEAARRIHAKGKKMYVTVNSLAFNDDIPKVKDYAHFLKDAGADSAIVSDLGVMAEIKAAEPDLAVHISTQMSSMNYRTCQVLYDMGASRVVLAREGSLQEAAELIDRIPKGLEIEGFVHGAMCMAYSGRCLISSFLTGRSGNRGECAQPCRWNYRLEEEKRPGEYFPIEEDAAGTRILSSRDMCALPLLDAMAQAGICSFKMEGRMKSPFYIASVTNAYRMAIDGAADREAIAKELCCISHRPYTCGFYIGQPGSPEDQEALGTWLRMDSDNGDYIRERTFVGSVLGEEAAPDGFTAVQVRNYFEIGQPMEVLSPGKPGMPCTAAELLDAAGNPIEKANHPMEVVYVKTETMLKAGDLLRADSWNKKR